MLRFLTAGESHGEKLIGILEGIPSNLKIDEKFINHELLRRKMGYGRSNRMKIESAKVKILSGINEYYYTTGAPLALEIINLGKEIPKVDYLEPRPGHADLAGLIK
ncbi:chorismate synthase, partial [Vibrio parahaemolyticus]|nr:chorismate synthase [Vibrio parahaemolyticus]